MFTQGGIEIGDEEAALELAKAIKAELGVLEEETEFLSHNAKKRGRGSLKIGKLKTNDDRCQISDKTREALPIGTVGRSTEKTLEEAIWTELVAVETFCPAHHDFSNTKEIDHVQSWDSLKTRTSKLVAFVDIQSNAFKETFFIETFSYFVNPQEDAEKYVKEAKRRNMGSVTKSNKSSDELRTLLTQKFARLRDTNPENLLSLCVKCNKDKGNKSAIDWLKHNEFFGEAFILGLEQAGGLHRGVIFDRIYGIDEQADQTIKWKHEGVEIEIYSGKGTGLGKFAKQWWMDNFYDVYLEHHTLKDNLYNELGFNLKKVSNLRKKAAELREIDPEKSAKYYKKANDLLINLRRSISALAISAKAGLVSKRIAIFSELIGSQSDSDDFYEFIEKLGSDSGNLREKVGKSIRNKVTTNDKGWLGGYTEEEVQSCLEQMSKAERKTLPHPLEIKALEELTKKSYVVIDSSVRIANLKDDLSMKKQTQPQGEVIFAKRDLRTSGYSRLRPRQPSAVEDILSKMLLTYRSASTSSNSSASSDDDDSENKTRNLLAENSIYNSSSIVSSMKRVKRLVIDNCADTNVDKSQVWKFLVALKDKDTKADASDWFNVINGFENFLNQKKSSEVDKISYEEMKEVLDSLFHATAPQLRAERAEKIALEERRLRKEAEKQAQETERKAQENERKAQEEIEQLREQLRRLSASGHTFVNQSPTSAISNFGIHARSSSAVEEPETQSSSEPVSNSEQQAYGLKNK